MENTNKFKVFDENGNLVEIEGNPLDYLGAPPVLERMLAYQVEEELNCLYDDIAAGLFGEPAKTGKFAAYVQAIKNQYPK
jgi:hypothetical protein